MKRAFLVLLCLLALGAAWFFWLRGGALAVKKSTVTTAPVAAVSPAATNQLAAGKAAKAALDSTNHLAFRLTNTKKTLAQLIGDQRAILLQNAFIDTAASLGGLKIPDNLKSKGDPGAYIVQSRGPISAAFRAALQAAGAQVVSYIPNNAYLVQMNASSAGMLSANSLVQAVLPYEPYYKLQPSLLAVAAQDDPLPPGTTLMVESFSTSLPETEKALAAAGAIVAGTPTSLPGGPVIIPVLAENPASWTKILQSPIVKWAEPVYQRIPANDLARVTLGISTDTVTNANWLGLSGANVMVEMNDSGVDWQHPDFDLNGQAGTPGSGASRVTGDFSFNFPDTSGHGTHVAGIIMGNGSESYTVTNPPQGSVTNADFRGKAPAADLYSVGGVFSYASDEYLQEAPALTNALISNNSWVYGGDPDYDLAAASYDAATRDALPLIPGAQPVLFVFAAGDNGGGSSDGTGGNADSIESPGTAKNVITVGALEELRDITNIVTVITDTGTNTTTNSSAIWQPETDSSSEVADYSSRGNVGVNIEGTYGRFKPDVVAPGSFVVSTSSGFNNEWDTNAYYNPTNISIIAYDDQTVTTNGLNNYPAVSVPPNAVGVTITITTNQNSFPFATNLYIYAQQSGPPLLSNPGAIDIITSNNMLAVPPGGGTISLSSIQNGGFDFAIGDSLTVPVNYNVTVAIATTNSDGNAEQVLEGLNNELAPYYRFESGTSMAAPAVSGTLALIQDYFTNTLHETPSPALLKAMLINGSRSVGGYTYAFTNGNNFQGWGLPNIQNSVPLTSTNLSSPTNGVNAPMFFVDQSISNALATGQSHTYIINIDTNASDFAQYLNLQATVVWTDPPGDPAAAIKLVNGLELIMTNLDTGEVFFGNDISPEFSYNLPWNTNGPPNVDTINNVENIILDPVSEATGLLGSRYSITVVGRQVNVNAVTEQTNNVVQDYALVVSVGNAGEVPNAITSVTDDDITSLNLDQDITDVVTTNSAYFNQFVGANTPFQGTNMVPLGTNTVWGSTGALVAGMTNQWHFYVVTNNALDPQGNSADVTNAAFITYDAYELSVPRMGVYEEADPTNATRPEADIDMYATTDASLTNLNPVAISNCLAGVNNSGASIGQGGTEYVYFTNSTHGQVYYIGIKSEDQMASEYDFLPVFTATPFSQIQPNGDEQVNGLLLPAAIPSGTPAQPGSTNVFALAIYPMQIENVIVTNLNQHQNFGDLVGTLSFGGASAVLNNHDGLGNTINTFIPLVYDGSADPVRGSRTNDGPGNLLAFQGKSVLGPWMLNELNNAPGLTGQVSQLTLVIQPHRDIQEPGITVSIPPGGWFMDYVTVPPGYTNLTFYATNLPPTIGPPPLVMYEKFASEPTTNNFDFAAGLTNTLAGSGTYPGGADPGNSISIGPPLAIGNYYIGIYNPSPSLTASVFIAANLGIDTSANDNFTYTSTGPQPLQGDAVTTGANGANLNIVVPAANTNLVESVNVGMVVQTPQIADMTFTLVSPTGQRVLLMENRGGASTNGAGGYFVYSNILNSTATGGAAANTNYLPVSPAGGTIPITYNFYTIPDQITIYAGTNPATFGPTTLLWNPGFLSNSPPVSVTTNIPYAAGISNITIIINEFGNPYDAGGGDAWTYTAGAVVTNFEYLTFTDDTNLTDVPIKYAVPPFYFAEVSSNYTLSDFDYASNGLYHALATITDSVSGGGWTVPTNITTYTTAFSLASNKIETFTNVEVLTNNFVCIVTDPADAVGDGAGSSNFLALAKGTITRSIPTVPGSQYNVTFWYRGPGIASWWRGEGNASDSSDPENNGNNGALVGLFNFPAGEVDQAFQFINYGNEFEFAGTNAYVQVPQSPSLDVGKGGGFTVEGWINPTNLSQPQPVIEWLAHVPTNTAITNIVIDAGPYYDPATGHYYYMLGTTDWLTSEQWATELGGHLATVNTANEQNWIFDNFAKFGGLNHNLWIGLTNNPGMGYGWSSGLTNLSYVNWLSGQPDNADGTEQYTGMLGETNAQAGLWVLATDAGLFYANATQSATDQFYGIVEVDQIQTNGVQFWISATNTPGTTSPPFASTNGCLYANLVDTNFVSHEIYSAPLLLRSNVFQHVALTYDTNSGVANLYLDGTNVASTNFGILTPIVAKTDGDVLLGHDLSPNTNNYFGGLMDEISVYQRALSPAEILAIYQTSAFTTNRTVGKFDPSVTPAAGLAEALVDFGGTTNVIFGVNDQWQEDSYTFTATSNSMPLRITGLEPGILLDDFAVSLAPVTNLYYLPEQSLDGLTGTPANGDWSLQVWDNLTGSVVTNLAGTLLSWQLSFVLQSNSMYAASLVPQGPSTNTIPAGQTVYFQVNVPSWAQEATNVLVSSTQPVNLLFNPTNLPTGSSPGDITLLTGSTNGTSLPIAVNTNTPYAPYQAGTSYILGVQNNKASPASVVLQVDYNITPLTNGVPNTSSFGTNDTVRYFSYTVGSNAYEATFQLLQLSGNADLVVSKGTPLPTLTNTDYGSFNASNYDENIYVFTNSSPVPLSPGTWYIGVVKRDPGVVDYTVLAQELDITNSLTNSVTIINLTNGVPFNWSAGPGAALTNFFVFTITNPIVGGITNYGVHFELYNLTGNGDLTVQTNALPLAPPFFQTSQNTGLNPESIMVFTNGTLTNLNGNWYLGVPNNEVTNINYTIVAETITNSYFPGFPGANGSGGGAVGAGHVGTISTVYHVTSSADSGPGTLRDAVTTTNRTVVFDVSGYINLLTPLIITNSYLTIAGQTAPAGGITVAGSVTTVTNAHDVIIRDVRFRPNGDIVWFNGFEGYTNATYVYNIAYNFAGGWSVVLGNIDLLSHIWNDVPVPQGSYFIDLNGNQPGEISTNISTVMNQLYILSFDYSGNPSGTTANETANVLINGVVVTNVVSIYNSTNTWSNIQWSTVSVPYRATSTNTLLDFTATSGGSGGVLLDAVSLTANNTVKTVWENGFEGYPGSVDISAGTHIAGGWYIDSGTVDENTSETGPGSVPYEGSDYLDLNGWGPGEISTNIPTVDGQQYILNFAYARNPDSVNGALGSPPAVPEAAILINGNQIGTVTCNETDTWADLDWEIATFTFKATSPSTALTFNALSSGPSGVLLDYVTLSTNVILDSLDFENVSNVVADHVSAEWSYNNLVSVLNSSNVTVQWSIMSDSLYVTNNPAPMGSLLRYGNGALSFNHDLYADNYTGNPRLGDNLSLDYVNNVVYDWGTNAGFSTNDSVSNPDGFTNNLNYDCNYIIAGSNSLPNNIAFFGGTPFTWIYQTNNFIDSNTNGILNGANTQWAMFTNQFTKVGHPFPLIAPPTDEAYLAYEKDLDFAGVDLGQRDPADTNIVSNVRQQTGTLIGSPSVLIPGNTGLPYLDTDQDGLPDFWEITFGQPPYVPSNNQASPNALGYTTLEEYDNWLAVPHALTVTNTPVGVDLQQLFGQSGHLSFFLTNSVHGSVYLTNVLAGVTNAGPLSNSIAVFAPTNNLGATTNYSGYASFDVYVTNTDTVAYFGPVTVSVVVSAVPIVINSNFPPVIITLGSLASQASALSLSYTNTNSGGSDYYDFNVTTNSVGLNPVAVLFTVTNATGPVDLVANYGLPLPSLSSYEYISTNSWTTSENILISSNSTPVALTNGNWYLGVVNVSGSNVTYVVQATEYFTASAPLFTYPTNGEVFTNVATYPFTVQCQATDVDNPPLPLTFALVSAPTNMTITPSGLINWTPTEEQGPTTNGPATNNILVSVSNGDYSVTNGFTIIVLATNQAPVFILTNIPNQTAIVSNLFVLNNAATNPNYPDYPLAYTLPGAPAGATIDANGVITWTPTLAQVGTYLLTTVVTDTNPWAVNATPLSTTNSFYVIVEPGVVPNQPLTNTVAPGSINWLAISVPTNAIAATNALLFATNLPVNILFSTNVPPTTGNAGDHDLLPNATNGVSVLNFSSTPAIVPGGVYFLGVQNPNGVSVGYALKVSFQLVSATSPVPISSIVYTNITGTNGFLLTWFAPSNDLFQVQWTTSLVSPTWNTFTNIVGYNTNAFTGPYHTQFNFFDNGTQTGGFGTTRYYRLILEITSGPTISNVTVTPSGVVLKWSAPTTDEFNVRWTPSLTPPITWNMFPNTITSTTGIFTFTDTNAPLEMKFYELLLLP